MRQKRALCLVLSIALSACAAVRQNPEQTSLTDADAPSAALIKRPRQLTFDGRRSGEGYFSHDGRKLVFQSEREPGNPFYQIYLMDFERGDVRRVSPGIGKTTCAWIHPSGERVLFASTHLDPEARSKQERELEARAAGTERRYAWDYDEHYDLFVVALDGGDPIRLGDARGYDAEASWAPDGRQIVFASNRHAYEIDLTPEERERFETDKSYFVDLYIMDARGRNVRRLTDTPGYDGGPFFSPDGNRIVWRRFSEDGDRAEIFTMKTDGSDVTQLTKLDEMSWAPFYHPSGDYIVFSTSLHGFDNFELYMVDSQGHSTPVRVTTNQGFDSLPAFSPDGEEIVWTRRSGSGGGSQLYLADWNDAAARPLLGLPSEHASVVAPLLELPDRTSPEIDRRDLKAHVQALSSEAAEGRLTGSTGERIATSYVARAFRAIGLEPAGDNGTYFQEFTFTAGVSLGERNLLRLEALDNPPTPFEVDRDWRPLAFSKVGEIEKSEVAFVGYGLVAPEGEHVEATDAYQDIDVQDRWALAFRYAPAGLSQPARRHLRRYMGARYKAMLARDRGARGLLIVSGPNSKVRRELAPLAFDTSLSGSSIAAVSITDALAEAVLQASGRTLGQLQDALDAGQEVPAFVVEGVQLAATIDLQQTRSRGRTVIARLPVAHEPTASSILIGAHVDHLGRGRGTASLALDDEKERIHYGADDNASGVAALIEIAEWLAHRQAAGGLKATRDVVFAAWSGEEIGLLGSSHFSKKLRDPHAQPGGSEGEGAGEPREIAAYLNLDMVGRLEDVVSVFGLASSSIWPGEIERRNAAVGLPVVPSNDSYLPTDATSFYLAGVPVLSAFTGAHEEYHTPRDTPDTLNYDGIRDIARLFAEITASLASRPEEPDYVRLARPEHSIARTGLRVYFGSIPDYSQTDIPGVRLAGVVAEGPADSGGLQAGDVIVDVGGHTVENIYDYTYALDMLEVGKPVDVIVLRGARQLTLSVVPGSRD